MTLLLEFAFAVQVFPSPLVLSAEDGLYKEPPLAGFLVSRCYEGLALWSLNFESSCTFSLRYLSPSHMSLRSRIRSSGQVS